MTNADDAPWEPVPGADERYAIFPKDHRVVADDGTPIGYALRDRGGDAIPVVAASGWSCSDVYWSRLVPALEAAGHTCLVPDTRAHGASGLPRSPGRGARNLSIDDVSMARLGRDLVCVMDDAGVDRAVVMGHSMGVQTALETYRAAPERVAALVLVAGCAENPAKTFYGTSIGNLTFPFVAEAVRWFPELLAPLWTAIGGPPSIGHLVARATRAAGPKASVEDLTPYLTHLASVDPAVVTLMAAAMRAHSAVDLLPEIDVPVLVVAAGADVFAPARCSEAIHHGIADSELVTFPGAGHTLPIEEPEALAAAVIDFLDRRAPTPAAAGRARRR
ncbi:MAG: alpha/beta hydrolase [Acidimicrobiales bacterium]